MTTYGCLAIQCMAMIATVQMTPRAAATKELRSLLSVGWAAAVVAGYSSAPARRKLTLSLDHRTFSLRAVATHPPSTHPFSQKHVSPPTGRSVGGVPPMKYNIVSFALSLSTPTSQPLTHQLNHSLIFH